MLRGVDLLVRPGEAIGLMGRNGMGKTTLIRTLMGQVPARAGAVLVDGREVTGEAPFRRARRGIAVVPEGRGVFGSLTVLENLRLAARPGADGAARPGRRSACWRSFRGLRSAAATAATSSRAGSSRCWPSAGR